MSHSTLRTLLALILTGVTLVLIGMWILSNTDTASLVGLAGLLAAAVAIIVALVSDARKP
jgi:hypothetical protein